MPKLSESITALIEEIVSAVVAGVLEGLQEEPAEEPAPKKKAAAKKEDPAPKKKASAKKKPVEDEGDEDEGYEDEDEGGDDEGEDEAPPKKKTTEKTETKKEPAKKRGAKKKSADDEDEGTDCPVEVGDTVEVHDDEEDEWIGPYTVNGIEGQTVTLFDEEDEDEFEIDCAEDWSDIRKKVAKKKVSRKK